MADRDPERGHRRSIRLDGYDYAEAGAYFVTVCTQGHACLFGEIADGSMRVNALGQAVQETWQDLPIHYPRVELDAFAVMPNHVHMVIILTQGQDLVGAGFKPALPQARQTTPGVPKCCGLGEVIRASKTFSARQINKCRGIQGVAVWQHNYYEHIIRHERALNHVRRYIMENPAATSPEAPDAWQVR